MSQVSFLMEFFMERNISIVHFKLSRLEPGKAIDVSIFADMTNSRDKRTKRGI